MVAKCWLPFNAWRSRQGWWAALVCPDAGKLADALYTNDRVGVTTRGGKDRPGIRVAHFYNSPAEVDRLLTGLSKYLKTGGKPPWRGGEARAGPSSRTAP